MANVLVKRLFIRNFIKFKNCTDLRSHCLCTNIFFINTQQSKHGVFKQENLLNCRIFPFSNENYRFLHNTNRKYNDNKDDKQQQQQQQEEPKKLSLFKKYKEMYKQYWYVVMPVHLVTSALWFGGFYYIAKSGVDVRSLFETLHISENIIKKMNESEMGYLAIAFALYKIATPARYAVTLGGTTVAINYLKKWGYIKPIPSRERLKEMYHKKKDSLMHGIKTTSDKMKKS